MNRIGSFVFWGLLTCVIPATGFGAQPYPWLAFKLQPLDPASYTGIRLSPERATEVSAAGHGAVVLLNREEIRLASDGTATVRSTRVSQLLDDEGVRRYGTQSVYVRSDASTFTVELAHVIAPDGRVVPLERAALQVQTDGRPDVFSDGYNVIAPFGGLVPGAVTVLQTVTRTNRHAWPLPWSFLDLPSETVPVERYALSATWAPPDAPLDFATDHPRLTCKLAGAHQVECQGERLEPVPTDDAVDSYYDVVPSLVLGEPLTWAQLATQDRALLEAAARADDGVPELLTHLLAGSVDESDRLRRIYRFVADDIRYVGMEHGHGAVRPRPAAETLRRRYGDCKDKVALFLALARAAGFEADGVLVAGRRYRLERLLRPSWRYFDHVIACVGRADSASRACVELTTADAPMGVLPMSLTGAVALTLRDDTTGPHLLAAPPYPWEVEVTVNNDVRCDGRVGEEVRQRLTGSAGVSLRGHLRGLTADERQRWAEQDYQKTLGNQERPAFKFEGLNRANDLGALELISTHEFGATSKPSEWKTYTDFDSWLVAFGRDLTAENRYFRYRVGGAKFTSRIVYRLCHALKPGHTGADLDFVGAFGRLHRTWQKEGQTVTVSTTLEVERREIPVSDLAPFNAQLRQALGQTGIWFSVTYDATREKKP